MPIAMLVKVRSNQSQSVFMVRCRVGKASKTDLRPSIETAGRIVPREEKNSNVPDFRVQRHLYLRSMNGTLGRKALHRKPSI